MAQNIKKNMAQNIKKNMCVVVVNDSIGGGQWVWTETELYTTTILQLALFHESGMKVKQEHFWGEMLGKNREASLIWRGCEEKPQVSHTVWGTHLATASCNSSCDESPRSNEHTHSNFVDRQVSEYSSERLRETRKGPARLEGSHLVRMSAAFQNTTT